LANKYPRPEPVSQSVGWSLAKRDSDSSHSMGQVIDISPIPRSLRYKKKTPIIAGAALSASRRRKHK